MKITISYEDTTFNFTATVTGERGDPGVEAAIAHALSFQKPVIVMLTDVGSNKIQVIKVIREITNMGLVEAKTLLEGQLPVRINPGKFSATDTIRRLAESGATAELR